MTPYQTKAPTEENKRVSKLAYFISKKVGEAIADYDMLHDGDKVVVGVSGGKDSLTLFKLLRYRQSFAPIRFDILPVHVDLGFPGGYPQRIAEYFESRGIGYRIERRDILEGKSPESINCFWCSWNRRKALFDLANSIGFNKIALGHHLDDIVETIVLNLFYQGQTSAMMPKQPLFEGKLTVVRPLAYITEAEIKRLTKTDSDFMHDYACPNAPNSKRERVKAIIRDIERECPAVKKNIINSIKRVKTEYLL